MSAALAEFRQRYRAARARLWAGPPEVVVRDILHLSAVPAYIYERPIGPRKPLFAESVVRPTSRELARRIVAETAAKYGFTPMDIVSMRRPQGLCDARNEIYYRLRHETTWSFPSIGRFLGDRDHTTVMSGAKKHAKRLEAGQ